MKSAEEIRYAMETYADMVRRICFVQLKNRDDTEDVFQNVYMKYIWNFWNTMKALRFRYMQNDSRRWNMGKKAIYCLGACLLAAQMFLSAVLPCYAAQIGSGATVESVEEKSFITSVTISPGTTVVSKDTKCGFTAYVAGVNDYSREVVWSVSGQKSQSTFIDTNGVLNVASDETASSMVVKAVSRQDSNYSAEALVTVRETMYDIQLQVSPENSGNVYGSGTVKEGTDVVISATPDEGFTFDCWTENGNRVSQDARYTINNVRGNVTYVAEFKRIVCRINVNVNDGNGGTATESRDINYGDGMVLEASAKEGYQFDGWTENGKTVSKDSRMPLDRVTQSRTFTAVFSKKDDKPKTYTITATASSENGTITPAGKSTVKEGEGILYTMTPKSGYAVSNVYVDGKSVGWMNSFNFTDVRENHTISVDFAQSAAKDNNDGAEKKPAQTDKKEEQKEDTTDKDKKTDQDRKEEKTDRNDDREKNDDEAPGEADGGQRQESGLTGTLKHLDVSVEEAERLVKGNNAAELMIGALETGDLQLTAHNDFCNGKQEISYYHFEAAVDYFLSAEEKMELLQGGAPAEINLYVEDTDGREPAQVQKEFAEKKLPGMSIGRYFEVSLTASKGGETETISELPTALKVVIDVPEHLKAEKRRFYVLRLHTKADGSREFAQLADEDDNPDTITFSTDKFSPYAIAYIDWQAGDEAASGMAGKEPGDRRFRNAAGIVIVLLALAVTVTGVLYIAGKRRR